MPRYDRKCLSCETVFEVTCKISEKHSKDFPCEKCGKTDGEWLMGAPQLVEHQRLSTAKKDTGFKEVLQKIAKNYPRSEITKQV